MNRRQFNKTLGIGLGAMAATDTIWASADDKPQLSITIDDFNFFGASPEIAERRNRTLLQTLHDHGNLKAAVFPVGKNIDSDFGRSLVRSWGTAGHLIGNHSYSHWLYPNRTFEEFSQDILRLEPLIEDMPGFTRRFRFPALKEGNTSEQRDKMRAFLKERGYQMGYVSVDASDWYIDQRLRARMSSNPKADVSDYRQYYLDHLWDRATFYDGLARRVLRRTIKHTLLIHHNVLNEMVLGDVLSMFRSRGWQLIHAQDAFADPIFKAIPNNVPAGESIVWALAKETGQFSDVLRYPGEDDTYEKPKMDKLGL